MPELRRINRWANEGNQRGPLAKILEAADELGIPLTGRAAADAAIARMRGLDALQVQPMKERTAAIDNLARRLGTGQISADDALRAALQIDIDANPSSAWHKVLQDGRRRALLDAWNALVDPEDEVFVPLKAAVEEIVAAVHNLRPQIPDTVFDDATARSAGPEAAAAWARYVRLIERWTALHRLVMDLRREALVARPILPGWFESGLLQPDRWADMLAREDFASTRRGIDPKYREPVRILLDDISLAWGPGIFTAAEIEADFAEANRAARAEEAAREGTKGESSRFAVRLL